MQLVYHCPVCDSLNYRDVSSTQRMLDCGSCDWHREISADHFDGGRPVNCLSCGNTDLWRQKDFPQGLGILMAATGATLSVIAWANYQPLLAFAILMVFAAIDMGLYVFMPDVLVCYRCKSRHRKADMHEDHPRFDLELAERYRQEEKRLAEAEQNKPA